MGEESRPSLSPGEVAARLIESAREQILSTYAERLASLGNSVAGDAHALEQSLANAGQIISDVVSSLRRGRVHVADDYRLIARGIGVTRARDGVHPKESLEAASAFFQTALSAMAQLIEPGPESLNQYVLVTLALEESLNLRVRESVSSYTGFLLQQVRRAQVAERRRIARDLHDRVGNTVSVAHRQLELYEMYRTSQPTKANAKVEAAQRAIQESMGNLRTVASDLHAPDPVQNLEKALRAYLNSASVEGVEIDLVVNGDEAWAPTTVLDETLLIVREAVANALRYASASVIAVDIEITPDTLRALVEDDGCGFDAGRVPAGRHGVGLKSMVERAELLDGAVRVNTRLGIGTLVEFRVPLKGRPDDRAG
ncbi:signal transduction histidine kinase [Catenulispora sp. GAS73]|uniref:sensor histidine kinase n=1 Tax=Catenulispora sp. GAS73 TaxID=3156269 RepID=UPI00351488F5